MTPIYLSATRLADFGADRLADHLLCRLREAPEHPFRPERLAKDLAEIRSEQDLRARIANSAEVAANEERLPAALAALTAEFVAGGRTEFDVIDGWRMETLRRIGDTPYRLGSPTLQLPFPARLALEVLALAIGGRRQLCGVPAEPALIEAPLAPPDAPAFGTGPDIVIVGDPQDRALPDLLDAAAALLSERAARMRWVWMHAPRIETPECAARAIQRQHLLAGKADAGIALIASILRVQGTPYVPALAHYPDDPRVAQVLGHLWILDACGVPRSRRPAIVFGRSLYIGTPDATLSDAVDAVLGSGTKVPL